MTDTRSARTIEDLPERFNAAEDLLAPNVVARPGKVAFHDVQGSITYGELAARVDRLAGHLLSLVSFPVTASYFACSTRAISR